MRPQKILSWDHAYPKLGGINPYSLQSIQWYQKI